VLLVLLEQRATGDLHSKLHPDRHAGINAELGQAFAHWITSLPTQALIASYERDGNQFFIPYSVPYRVANQ
jgi:ABC-type tungstate transport system permease subunit